MNESLRRNLLALAEDDLRVWEALAADGGLFQGYRPEMQAVHERNAAALSVIVSEYGWPTSDLVGEDGARAAWLVAQHAIGLPDFQRECLAALQTIASYGLVPLWQPAFLLDRIRTLEGRRQEFGSQFDWDDAGEMSPLPIEDAEHVDQRRSTVGIPPLAETIAQHRSGLTAEHRPADLRARSDEMADWARRVGWRRDERPGAI